MFKRFIQPAGALILLMTLMLGVAYPLLVTVVGHLLFQSKAAGSLIYSGDTVLGSRLVGQNFAEPRYVWGRPSATSTQPYNGLASGGSNVGPLSPVLLETVKANADRLRAADPGNSRLIPVDLVTASASGLDPDISRAAADYQAARVAGARHLPLSAVQALIRAQESAPLFGFLGEPTVNVLALNLALDRLQ